ncbi:MAG: AAA domain-containing protein [Candidatus Kapaibacteriales bacterium]
MQVKFKNDYERICHIIDKSSLSLNQKDQLKKIPYQYSNKKKKSSSKTTLVHENSIDYQKDQHPEKGNHTERLLEILSSEFSINKPDQYHSLKVRVASKPKITKGNHNFISRFTCHRIFANGDIEPLELAMSGVWAGQSNSYWRDLELNLIDFKSTSKNGQTVFYSTRKSIVVMEPDYLVDVSEIASCFDMYGSDIGSYLLKRYVNDTSSQAMLLGNMVNTLFDEMIVDHVEQSKRSFDEYYEQIIKSSGISLFVHIKRKTLNKSILINTLKIHYENIKTAISTLDTSMLTTEPSFISITYGLQGRLDLLSEKEGKLKEIYELKSGKPPQSSLNLKFKRGRFFSSIAWPSHYAQIIGYNLLLDSAFEGRAGSSYVVYSKTPLDTIRNINTTITSKQNFILQRNQFVIEERANILGTFKPDKALRVYLDTAPVYSKNDVKQSLNHLDKLDEVEKKYYEGISRFISAETYAGRISGDAEQVNSTRDKAFSSIWKKREDSNASSSNTLENLKFLSIDTQKNHIVLKRSDNNDVSLRKGDAVILYSLVKNQLGFWDFSGSVVKASILEIDESNVKLTLRNKLLPAETITERTRWNLSSDYFDKVIRKIHPEAFQYTSQYWFKYDIGQLPPEFDSIDQSAQSYLQNLKKATDEQRQYLADAIMAKNYFLLQGPPGTGKTRYFISVLLDYYNRHTEKKILVTAFTNRAVDEICSSLSPSAKKNTIRISSRENSEVQELLLVNISDEIGTQRTYAKLLKTNIIAMTVSSAVSKSEIFEFFDFDLVIVDEAGQLPEYMTSGIFSRIKKKILVGDQKQLPPITSVQNDKLHIDLGFTMVKPEESYFSRMIELCQNKTTDKDILFEKAYRSLSFQGRMCQPIMDAANYLSYEGQLQMLDPLTANGLSNIRIDGTGLQYGINLINTDGATEKNSFFEAVKCIELVEKLASNYSSLKGNEIGILSPFRIQCTTIRNLLKNKGIDNVTVDTVERYQGSQRDHIILSMATKDLNYLDMAVSEYNYTSKSGEIITIDRKLNVALTRARATFTILGDLKILYNKSYYRKLIDNIEKYQSSTIV